MNKLKIAILTHYSYIINNFGQKLQNVALSYYLRNLFNTEEIFTYTYHSKQIENYSEFVKLIIYNRYNLNLYNNDLYVYGSDQVWKDDITRKNDKVIYGIDLIKKQKRHLISYSVSENDKLNLINIKKNFRYISFREKSSFNKFSKLFKCTYNIDPIFLISKKFWESLEKQPNFIKNNEIFDFYYQKGKKEFKIINENNLIKIKLYFNNRFLSNRLTNENFLWLIHHCRNLITDSFHGFAFGIIYQKNNINFKKDFRTNNLIDILNIKFDNNRIINYDEIQEKIKFEQNRSLDYFKNMKFNYACYSKDKFIHDNSTSGGVCAELAKYVFENNGLVYGGAYNEDFTKVIVKPVDNIDDYLKYLSKSKYNFSFMPKLKDIKDQLDSGKLIMYIGSPCQILSLKTYLNKDYDNLILVDFRCRGFSSPNKLKTFVENINKEHPCGIKNIDFRPNHKTNSIKVLLNDGNIINYGESKYKDFIFNSFDKCKQCKFEHGLISYSDIIISDFWFNKKDKYKLGKEFTPEKGCNHVRTNSIKGFIIFNKIKNNLKFRELKNGF